jgi:3-oxoadipate enol-lactonase
VNTLEVMAEDLVRLLDHLSVARVCIVGLSMGGQVAMEFARAYPDRTAGAVLAATFPQAETPDGVDLRNPMADRVLTEGIALAGSEMLPKLVGRRALKELPPIAAGIYRMICATDPTGAAAAPRGRALRRDYREGLKLFQFPCLIVLGADDAYSTITRSGSNARSHSQFATGNLSGHGHMPNLESEDRFNRHLHEFLGHVPW